MELQFNIEQNMNQKQTKKKLSEPKKEKRMKEKNNATVRMEQNLIRGGGLSACVTMKPPPEQN